jgi:flagellar biosynthetic protein FliQ
MDPVAAVDLAQKTLLAGLTICAPLLGAVLLLALLIAIVTTVFNLQEQTLSVVPKICAAFALSIALAPWILRRLMEFTIPLIRDVLAART